MRRPHFLAHNLGSERPSEVVVMDTETTERELPEGRQGHELVFGWARYARKHRGGRWTKEVWARFTTRREFWNFVVRRARPKGRLTIYCHNAEFDAQVVDAFGEMRRRGWKLVTACLEGPPTIIKWRRGKRTIQWLDTLNLWRVSLAEIGRKVGREKLDMPASWDDQLTADTYCRNDVQIVWDALTEWWSFLDQHDLGNAAPTLAAQAMTSFRHRFMRHPIFIDDNPQALALARSAYFGGRCECFRLGLIDEPGVTLDVNSMYPFVMERMQVPTQLLTVRTTATLAELERYAKRYRVIAEVDLDTELPAYPHLIGGRLCFPVGRFRQTLATPELQLALAHGHVKRLYKVAIYECAPAFQEFMRWGWQQRQVAKATGDAMLLEQSKRLINAFYGKWGQRGRVWQVIGKAEGAGVRSIDSLDIDTGKWRRLRELGGALQELSDEGESMNSHPAIAAHVTSEARLYLWQLIEQAGRANVWYCDTDSLKGPAALLQLLAPAVRGSELGGLKLEERHRWVELRGCKDYTTPQHEKIKGVRREAQTSDNVAYLQTRWQGWKGAIASGRVDMPVTSELVKVLTREYHKGIVLPDGTVEPLRLPLSGPIVPDGVKVREGLRRSL